MKLSQKCVDLVSRFEGCKLLAYQDVVGTWTVGFGATGPDIYQGVQWTADEALADLENRLTKVATNISSYLEVVLTDNEFDAICSLVYNIGLGAFQHSTLLKCLNDRDWAAAADEFLKWDHAGGREVPGLYARRLAEQKLFNTPDGEDVT